MCQPLPAGDYKFYSKLPNSFDINKCDQLGFVQAIVTVPLNTYMPLLPLRITFTKNSETKLIFPKGRFKGVWYIAELQNLEKYGYTVEPISAVLYDSQEYLLKGYVDSIYQMRLEAKKNHDAVGNHIYKLLLNSLYGRLGLRQDTSETHIVPSHFKEAVLAHVQFNEFHDYGNYSFINISRNNVFQSLHNVMCNNEENEYIHWLRSTLTQKISKIQSSVHLASAITALSRRHVAQTLIDYQNNIYYTDTDSVYMDIEMDKKSVSSDQIGL